MRKFYALVATALSSLAFAQQGAPAAPYYNGFNWTLTGTSLRTALATLTINKHTNNLSYSEVWDALQLVDRDPSNTSNVLLVYGWENGADGDDTNDRSRDRFENGGDLGEWNREHTFAQALGNPALGQTGPGADAHHLRASDVQRNNMRGNLKFASGSGIPSGTSGSGWYPGDEWKGDIARMMMYMYLRYGSQCLPTAVGLGATASTDANMPQIFLQWNAEDPVSQYEDNRNSYMDSNGAFAQRNRNPFIDNPYLATVIWGGPVAQNRWPNLSTVDYAWETSVSVYPNPTHGKINISSEADLEEIEIISVNGQVIMRVQNPVFSDNTFSIDNLPKGFYLMRITSDNKSMVKKVLVN
ncbi:endonuclease [Flavobacterium selenitireducens]|uniref:endonuclease n=1 Tax=Flavobacterium selenitireducens TaxID=2722704 RepID=UPI00168BE1F6|nr:endonuclease [Flavobacterium selenitireducens]MBD3581432.1 T9SS type A sorting domain-containing protein [Flavobacterium selenitireducens]